MEKEINLIEFLIEIINTTLMIGKLDQIKL